MGWSNGKTYAAARLFERAGIVRIEKAIEKWAFRAHHQGKDLGRIYTPEEPAEMRQPEFMDKVEAIVKKGT
jgi:hypothetical protein